MITKAGHVIIYNKQVINIFYFKMYFFKGIQQMISFLIGLVGAIIGVVGWVGFGSIWALIIGLVAYIIETIMEKDSLNNSAIITDIFVFGIGCLIGLFVKSVPFYIMGLMFINLYSLLMGILGVVALVKTR